MQKRTILSAFIFLGLFFFLSSFAHSALVGKVSSMEGRADVLKVGTKTLTPVKTGSPVDIGDIFRVKSDGKVEITCNLAHYSNQSFSRYCDHRIIN